MILSVEKLMAIARDHWRADKDYDFRLDRSPETQRLDQRWERAVEEMDRWRALLGSVREELTDFRIGNITSTCDACLRCGAYPESNRQDPTLSWVVVGCLSILAPVYTVYGVRREYRGKKRIEEVLFEPLPELLRAPARIIARNIETRYEATLLPREVADTPVPLIVEPREPPETTLFHALFLSEPARVP
ncbi:hypothetical protein [Pyxidicoccus sp. MSG2]|uniref:hypothetical protein n=1 Tax=Pyxidicoccus sp. MSG2 TaxID=2996790 RepID=UPI00226D8057|nr:hypothetical protein [Pyxidicoccus sp. MSG2]MCY1017864.1 hypothetical protein [Pyxidicoccus sp. MSG2]